MMTVEIETDNEAFSDDARGHELARILRNIADKVEGLGSHSDRGKAFDINGNSVARWEVF